MCIFHLISFWLVNCVLLAYHYQPNTAVQARLKLLLFTGGRSLEL